MVDDDFLSTPPRHMHMHASATAAAGRTNSPASRRHLLAVITTARGSFTTPFFHQNMLNETYKHVWLHYIRILVDSRTFSIWSASGQNDCENISQDWMTMCYRLLQQHSTMNVYFMIISTYTINCSLAGVGLHKRQAFKRISPKEFFFGYASLRRYRRVWRYACQHDHQ